MIRLFMLEKRLILRKLPSDETEKVDTEAEDRTSGSSIASATMGWCAIASDAENFKSEPRPFPE